MNGVLSGIQTLPLLDGLRPTFEEMGAAPTASVRRVPGSIAAVAGIYYWQAGTLSTPKWIVINNMAVASGVSGGQTIIGGTGAGDDLTLQSTSHATVGTIDIGGIAGNGRILVNETTVGVFANASQDFLLIENDGAYLEGLDLNVTGGRIRLSGALLEIKGGNVASASTMTFPVAPALNGGNYFETTGTTTINHITTTGWQSGARIELYFQGALTVTHNAGAPPANTAPIRLAGAVNLAAAAGSTLSLRYDAANAWWREVGRTAA